MPSDRLGGVTPLTAFTALPGGSQLRSILDPKIGLDVTVEWLQEGIARHLDSTRAALDKMHAGVTDASEKRL